MVGLGNCREFFVILFTSAPSSILIRESEFMFSYRRFFFCPDLYLYIRTLLGMKKHVLIRVFLSGSLISESAGVDWIPGIRIDA